MELLINLLAGYWVRLVFVSASSTRVADGETQPGPDS